MESGRILGLDVGSARVGVAVSDETCTIAQPLKALDAGAGSDALVRDIEALCREYSVETIVIGLPRSLSGGARGMSARRARRLGDLLAERLGVAIAYWDERFTTTEAERLLIGADVGRKKRRQVVDQVAAALILGGYMERNAK